jgi:hypothetical protein
MAWDKIITAEPGTTKYYGEIAAVYEAIGDLYADCKPENNFSLCKVGTLNASTKKRVRLVEASRWYEKAINVGRRSPTANANESFTNISAKLEACLTHLNNGRRR